ncbi:prolyl aminopeptidase [Gammaproteobacteria bacterium 53_120_T64]|nr:prolyl aminopeptidase [Gammaproteobacteria bacterium 53_120_T64]
MRSLYPAIKPHRTEQLDVGDGHSLYVEECGNPDGLPVVFVHGGPGAGCTPQDRCFFDPEVYRIVLFDQRGSGRSTPHAGLEENSTQALVADMELLRESLGIQQWQLFGGSWGSTLSLIYAQTHPDKVLGMVLRGIFLCRDEDIHWFYQRGASAIFPDHWQDFIAPIPEGERDDFLGAYHRRLTGDNELERIRVAKAWSLWEARCATLDPNRRVVERLGSPHVALAMARIEAHYFINQCYIADQPILQNMDKLVDIPAIAVHGRYDMVCPVKQAFDLQAEWPELSLEIIRDAGHASSERPTVDALVKATDLMAKIVKNRADD